MKRRELLNKLETKIRKKYQISDEDFKILETVVVKGIPHHAGLQWRFAGAFYFATLVITTVGYGHSTPATTQGKAFCILYAVAGIPLGLVMFQSIGERLNALISAVLSAAKRELGIRRELTPTHLILVSGAVGSIVICFGTYVFHRWEGWSLFDAYYYCMMTMTTVGFGDFVPLQTDEQLNTDPGYVIFTLVFILFGLAVFSASVNLFVLRFMSTGMDTEASESEPKKRVILENFSNTPSPALSMDPGQGSRHPIDSIRVHQQQQRLRPVEKPKLNCGAQCRRESRFLANKGGTLEYTVRRAPSRIAHLLPPPSLTESDSFLLHQLGGRRTSL